MEGIPVKKKLRRLHKLLVNSRYALEQTSSAVNSTLLGNLLFTMSCRRNIMLNQLDRELGRLHLTNTPDAGVTEHFKVFPASSTGPERYVQACEAEEVFFAQQLEHLSLQPGLRSRTRDAILNMLHQTRENLKDILFLRDNHPAFRG